VRGYTMTLNLYQTIPNKVRTLAFSGLMTLIACGDTNNHNYYVNGQKDDGKVVEIKTCEDFANRLYECSPQNFEYHKNLWGTSIEEQLKDAIEECAGDSGSDFFTYAPEFVNCIATSSCEELNPAGSVIKPWLVKCGKYIDGF